MVEHDVKAQDLEAHRVLKVVELTLAEHVLQLRLPADQSLHDDVLDAGHHWRRVYALALLQVLHCELKTPLVAH